MKKYKVTNKLNQPVNCGKLSFAANETKIMDYIPGKGFYIEEFEEIEQPKINKQEVKKYGTTRHVVRSGKNSNSSPRRN